jgi:hypothetical protein
MKPNWLEMHRETQAEIDVIEIKRFSCFRADPGLGKKE